MTSNDMASIGFISLDVGRVFQNYCGNKQYARNLTLTAGIAPPLKSKVKDVLEVLDWSKPLPLLQDSNMDSIKSAQSWNDLISQFDTQFPEKKYGEVRLFCNNNDLCERSFRRAYRKYGKHRINPNIKKVESDS